MSFQRPDIAMEWRLALRVLRHQAWIIVLCILIAGGVAYWLAHSQSIKYEAAAGLLVHSYAQDLALPNEPALFTDPTRGRATAVQLITSPVVSRMVVASCIRRASTRRSRRRPAATPMSCR
jgi:uncharacterized protein involved in exopolysaccharide biosynthesis